MIFSRRTIQRCLDDLRLTLGDEATAKLAARLNLPGRDRIAAMWEVVVLRALSPLGILVSEVALESGRRPDVRFQGLAVSFTADITTASDEGLDDQNPVFLFRDEIEKLKTRLGLPLGGVDLRVGERTVSTNRGSRRVVKLPPRSAVQTFVTTKIAPALRQQIREGKDVLSLDYKDADVEFILRVDPAQAPFSTTGYGAYDHPTIRDRNPLYNALKSKADQLRAAQGLKGIIVGDGDTLAIASHHPNWSVVSTKQIVDEFFRQHGSIGFVVLLTVEQGAQISPQRRVPQLRVQLLTRPGLGEASALDDLFSQFKACIPRPANSAVNGALRARESGYGWGFHGGGTLSARRVKISAREVMEVLAGRLSIARLNELHDWRLASETSRRGFQNVFERWLDEGRLPTSMSIVPGDEHDADDWIEIVVGEPDAAISRFK